MCCGCIGLVRSGPLSPLTHRLLATGQISGWVTSIVARETTALCLEDKGRADAHLVAKLASPRRGWRNQPGERARPMRAGLLRQRTRRLEHLGHRYRPASHSHHHAHGPHLPVPGATGARTVRDRLKWPGNLDSWPSPCPGLPWVGGSGGLDACTPGFNSASSTTRLGESSGWRPSPLRR